MNKSIMTIINERASCRNFEKKEIPKKIVEQLLGAACQAPSAGGFQNYSIIKITDITKKKSYQSLAKIRNLFLKLL